MQFIDQHRKQLHGILHGFDRMIFRGYLNSFFSPKGMYYYMSQNQVKLTGFKTFMDNQHKSFRQYIEQIARQENVLIHYVNNAQQSKESIAKKDLTQRSNKLGLISIISVKETAYTFRLRGNKALKELEAVRDLRPHLHYYLYYQVHVSLKSQ